MKKRSVVLALVALATVSFSVAGFIGPAYASPHRVHLEALRCDVGHESRDRGSDELYIKVNGTKQWEKGNVDPRELHAIDRGYDFRGHIDIELFEDDWPDDDDNLGKETLYENSKRKGKLYFAGCRISYHIHP